MPYSALQIPCCCAAGGGIVDPGEGQFTNCELFRTCMDAGWLPEAVGYTTSGSKLTLGLPSPFFGQQVVPYWPDTTVLIDDVRTSPIGRYEIGNFTYFRFGCEVDFSAEIDCTSCQTSDSGTLSREVWIFCRTDLYVQNQLFGVTSGGEFPSGHIVESACGQYGISFGSYGEPLTYIRHSEIDGTGCVALSQVSFVIPLTVSFTTIVCGTTLNDPWPNPTNGNVINLVFKLVTEP